MSTEYSFNTEVRLTEEEKVELLNLLGIGYTKDGRVVSEVVESVFTKFRDGLRGIKTQRELGEDKELEEIFTFNRVFGRENPEGGGVYIPLSTYEPLEVIQHVVGITVWGEVSEWGEDVERLLGLIRYKEGGYYGEYGLSRTVDGQDVRYGDGCEEHLPGYYRIGGMCYCCNVGEFRRIMTNYLIEQCSDILLRESVENERYVKVMKFVEGVRERELEPENWHKTGI